MSQVTIDPTGKVALVTGGGYGKGRASARRFVASGARVVVADIDVARGLETVELVLEAEGVASLVETDVSQPEAVADMVTFTTTTYGGLDYAHNNAGIIGPQHSVVDYPLDLWDDVIGTNLKGVFLCLKHEIPAMLARGGGAIVPSRRRRPTRATSAASPTPRASTGSWASRPWWGCSTRGAASASTPSHPIMWTTGIIEAAREFLTPDKLRRMETIQPLGRLARTPGGASAEAACRTGRHNRSLP